MEVYTPYRLFFKSEVQFAIIPLIDGEIGVYANRAPFTAPVTTGILRLKDKKGALLYAVISEGIVEVKKNKTVLLINSANWPHEIDVERARAAKIEAEKTIKDNAFKLDSEKAQKKLKRAEIRLKLYEEMLKQTAVPQND